MTDQVDVNTHQHRPEGAKRHVVTYIVSLILTAFAFLAVIIGNGAQWVIPFIVGLAVIQVLFQLYIWMHMDQKGHTFPAIAIWMGIVFVIAFVITFIYWLGGW